MKNSMIHKGKDKNYSLNNQAHGKKKKKGKLLFFEQLPFLFIGWATWIRTRNDRTRICSVTITP